MTPVGRHEPKYTSATAMKPIPAVRFCWKMPSSRASAPPAMPAIMLATRMVT